MKSIMITAPSSNTGKTIVTLGIIRALVKRGIDVSPFKTGPDFIDRRYLEKAANKLAGNLDTHLMGLTGIQVAVGMNQGDLAVIEGAMGYFDGISNTFINSSYDISCILNTNAVLVYSPKGEMFSAVAKIKGMVDFEDSRIKAVILNKTNKAIYEMLKEPIETYTGVKVLGYIPNYDSLKVETSRLGLIDVYSDKYSDNLIDMAAKKVEETIDIDSLINLASDINKIEKFKLKNKAIKIAIARDEAFNFHYNENLKIFNALGNVEYFSPLYDKKLPLADLVIIGGGYPELYIEKLSKNVDMKKSIKEYVESGGYLLAESGGLMYLTEKLNGLSMVGVFKGYSKTTDKLKRFGYVNMELLEGGLYGEKGTILNGNEYHKSEVFIDKEEIIKVTKPKSKRQWKCGYRYKNALAYYQHLNYLGNLEAIDFLTDIIKKER